MVCGDNLKSYYLRVGDTVEIWKDLYSFPEVEGGKVTANESSKVFARIPETSSCAVFIPKKTYNWKTGVVGIFATATRDYVAL